MKINSKTEEVDITLDVNDKFRVATQMCEGKESPFLVAGNTAQGGDRLVIRLSNGHLFSLKQEIERHLFERPLKNE